MEMFVFTCWSLCSAEELWSQPLLAKVYHVCFGYEQNHETLPTQIVNNICIKYLFLTILFCIIKANLEVSHLAKDPQR